MFCFWTISVIRIILQKNGWRPTVETVVIWWFVQDYLAYKTEWKTYKKKRLNFLISQTKTSRQIISLKIS